jgi:DNA-3-methyladenine glycosylase I
MEKEPCGPPKWFHKTGTHPSTDDGYFENMTRVIFQAGLSWRLIERKWPNFRKAFENFSVNRVARFGDDDAGRLMADAGIVRNRRKILATIHNAKQLLTIKKEFGSFQAYINTLDKSNNYALVIKQLSKKFKHLGSSSARIFLYSVGEDIKHIPEG